MRALQSLACCLLAATAAAADCDSRAARGCSAGSLEPYSEREVELVEEEIADDLRFELLQRDLQRSKAIQTPGDQRKGTEESEPLALAATEATNSESVGETGSLSENEREGEADLEAESVGLEDPEAPAVDCEKYPVFCSPKVNCAAAPVSKEEKSKWGGKLATDDGHANPRSWCMVYPLYSVALSKCIVEDDKPTYAQMMYEDQSKAGLTDADAVYCFVSGHCNNTKVNLNTTVSQAEEICEELYDESWKSVGWNDFMGVVARARDTMVKDKKALEEGSLTWKDMMALAKKEASISAMTACAMGNFQCDVFYCKANYCENETYKKQFGNMSWPV